MTTSQGNGSQGQAPGAASQQGQAPAATQDQQQQPTGPQAGQGQAPAGQTDTAGQQADTGQVDLSTVQDPAVRAILERQAHELAEARQEAARYRTERGALQQQVQEFQRQNETDQERIAREAAEVKAEADALRAENRTLKVGAAVTEAAVAAKAFNPAIVVGLLDGRLEFDDKGQPTNVAALLAALQQSDPYLFQRPPAGADAGAGQGAGGAGITGGVNAMIRGGGRPTVTR